MEIDDILLLRTFILFSPYVLVAIVFEKMIRDSFFLKPRTYIQLQLIMIFLIIIFVEVVLWHSTLKSYGYIGFWWASEQKDSSNFILILLGILAAVLGWLFTYRGQVLTSIRSHSIQTLMASRLSSEYMGQVRLATEVYNEHKSRNLAFIKYEDFSKLDSKKIDAILYLLNYFEFVAVGIRFGDLDERLMKNTMRSIIGANYAFFEEIIKEKQMKSPTIYEHLTALNSRWSER